MCFLPILERETTYVFLFASLDDETTPKNVCSWGKESACREANSFYLELTSIKYGGKNKMTELLPLKVYSVTVKQTVHGKSTKISQYILWEKKERNMS